MFRRVLLLLVSALPGALLAGVTPEPLPIHTHTLSNGLKVVVVPDKRSPTVWVQLLYRVGGSYESRNKTGLSHALEHMMFRGTPSYPKDSFTKAIVEVGGNVNAYTSSDITVYHETLSKNHLELALKLEADRMQHLTLAPEDFTKELEVIKEERRMRVDDNPFSATIEQLNAVAMNGGSYQNPVIGWAEDIAGFTVEDLRAWYQKWYAPNNAILSVVGDVEPKAVFELVETHFGPLKAEATIPVAMLRAQDPVLAKGERVVNVKAPGSMPFVVISYLAPSFSKQEAEWEPYATVVLSALLSTGNNSYLNEILVRKEKVASFAQASYDPFARGVTQFTLLAAPVGEIAPAKLKERLQAIAQTIVAEPPSEEMLDKVKKLITVHAIYEQDDGSKTAENMLTAVAYDMPATMVNDFHKRIAEVTPKQVQAVAKQIFNLDAGTVGYFYPQKDKDSVTDSSHSSDPQEVSNDSEKSS